MERTAAPGKRLEVEEMRDRDRLHIWSQLGLALEQDVVVPKRVVLHVIVGMRRQLRAVRIHRLGITCAGAILIVATRNKTIGDPSPLPRSQVKGVHTGAEIVVVTAPVDDHRTARSIPRRISRAVPSLGNRAESGYALPRRLRLPSQHSAAALPDR